jgi:1-acyl-sn-glycerol-3-phosphate acyltransferase
VLRRRLVSIPAIVVGFVLLTPLLPVVGLVAVVVDLVRARFRLPTARLVLFGWWYLLAETLGLVVLGVSWITTLGRTEARASQTFAVQRWWSGTLYAGLRALFGFRIELDEGDARLDAGPYVVLMRHASIADTLVPSVTIANPYGMNLRYVLKSELLADPCLDIAGNRVPNVFVRRGRAGADVPAVAALAEGLGPDDAVLIYPEGTRFTAEKRRRLVESGRRRIAGQAESLRHVLPPRPGGPAALVRAGHDVVFLAHRGLEGLAGIRDLFDGALIGARVTAATWRVRASDVDLDRVDEWLFDQWLRVDGWIASAIPASE